MYYLTIRLSDEKLLYYRKVYGFFDLLEDFGGIVGSFQMLLMPLASYSSILMTNLLLNTHFVFEDKHADKSYGELLSSSKTNRLNRLKPFGYTYIRYMCSRITNSTTDNRFLRLRRKGEAQLQEVLDVENLLKWSKMIKLMTKMMFSTKFE